MDTILVNRYQIIRPLGSGGFGDTYIATDLHSPKRKKVVVKSLKPVHYETNSEVVEKLFLKEASVLEDLGVNYQQIPTLNAFFSLDNQYYLVQEYIEGKSLKEFGIISPEQCFQILSSLLETLKYIHSQNIIHRDIKPENIIIRESKEKDKPESLIPVLIDFGAVKETMGAINLSDGSVVSSVIVGTKGFMPLEQGMGKTVFSSDLYSLALTMVYSLTGKYPIAFPTNPLNGEIEWDSVTTNIPDHLKQILQKATKIDTLQRYSTAEEMYHALHQHEIPEDNLSQTLVVSPPHQKKLNTSQNNLSEEFPTVVVNKFGKNNSQSFVPTESLSNNNHAKNIDNNKDKNNLFLIFILFFIVIILGILGGFFITQMSNLFFNGTTNNGNEIIDNNNISSQEAVETVEKLYVFISEKEFDQAYHLYSPEMQSKFSGDFFEQFERVTVEDLSVTSQTTTSVDLIGSNTYFYPDGSTQREERSYRLEKLNGSPIIVSSEFIRVTKPR